MTMNIIIIINILLLYRRGKGVYGLEGELGGLSGQGESFMNWQNGWECL
jgi:hypothetical protein